MDLQNLRNSPINAPKVMSADTPANIAAEITPIQVVNEADISARTGVLKTLAWKAKNPWNGNAIDKLLKTTQNDDYLNLFLKIAESLRNYSIGDPIYFLASGMSELITAKPTDPQWELFKNVLESLIKSGRAADVRFVASGMSKLITAKPTDPQWELFKNVAESLINSGKADYVSDLAKGMSEVITPNISENVLKKTIEIYNSVQELNDLPDLDHEERKVDLSSWYSENALAVANLEIISPDVHNFVINSFLTQRKNPAHYTGEISVCSELFSDTVQDLKDLYNSNKALFTSDQLFLLRIISYVSACDKLGLNVFEDLELKNHTSNQKDLTRFLGNKLFTKVAEDLEIEIPENYDVEKFLQSWDLRNLGALLNTRKSWDENDTKLFKLLIESKIKNIEGGILTQNKKGLPELSKYGSEENQNLVKRLRESHDKFLAEMAESGLDGNKWINAHNEIQETSNVSQAKEKGAKELLKELKTRFEAFKHYAENNNLVPENMTKIWDRITRSEIIRQLTLENPKDSILSGEKKEYLNKTLTGFISEIKKQISDPNDVPEEISDLEITIREINNFDPDKVKEKKKENITTSIWNPLDIGHNLFAGNRANSCTALGRNATAIFYLNCDPGTKYVYVKNEKGNIAGYARIFLALDKEGKPKIYVDSIDGKAHNHNDAVNKKITELTKLIGLTEDDILDRSGTLSKKIGESPFSEKYFHHSNLKLEAAV